MEKKYKVFISYCSEDEVYAKSLFNYLRFYIPPNEILKEKGIKYRDWKRWEIFRDKTSLSVTYNEDSNLKNVLKDKLDNSEFLMVICSRNYVNKNKGIAWEESWGKGEIEYFKEKHGNTNENIITVLAIRKEDKITRNNKNLYFLEELITSNDIALDILSAIVYHPVNFIMNRKFYNEEAHKLIAPLLNCETEKLFRFEQKRKRRNLSVFLVVSLIISCLISFLFFNSVRQKRQIEIQNNEIIRINDALSEKNNELSIENASHLINESNSFFSYGKVNDAIENAILAMPSCENDIPLIKGAVYNLTEKLQVYNKKIIQQELILEHDDNIWSIIYFDEKTIVTGTTKYVYVWDRLTGQLINKASTIDKGTWFLLNNEVMQDEQEIEIDCGKNIYQNYKQTDNNIITECLVYSSTKNILKQEKKYDDIWLRNTENIFKINLHNGEVIKADFILNSDDLAKTRYLNDVLFIDKIETSNKLEIINKDDLTIKSSLDASSLNVDNVNYLGVYCFSPTLDYLIYKYSQDGMYYYRKAEIKDNLVMPIEKLIKLSDGSIFVQSGENIYVYNYVYDYSTNTTLINLYAYNKDFNFKWNKTYNLGEIVNVINEVGDNIGLIQPFIFFDSSKTKNYDNIVCIIGGENNNKIFVLNDSDGSIIHIFNFEQSIKSYQKAVNGYLTVFLQNGEEYVVKLSDIKENNDVFITYKTASFPFDVHLEKNHNNSFAIVTKDENSHSSIKILELKKNDDYTKILEDELIENIVHTYKVLSISSSGDYIIFVDTEECEIIGNQIIYKQNSPILRVLNTKKNTITTLNHGWLPSAIIIFGFMDETHFATHDSLQNALLIHDIQNDTIKKIDISELEFGPSVCRISDGKIIGMGWIVDTLGNVERYPYNFNESFINYNNVYLEIVRDNLEIIRMKDNQIQIYEKDGKTLKKSIECLDLQYQPLNIFEISTDYIGVYCDPGIVFKVNLETGNIESSMFLKQIYENGRMLNSGHLVSVQHINNDMIIIAFEGDIKKDTL